MYLFLHLQAPWHKHPLCLLLGVGRANGQNLDMSLGDEGSLVLGKARLIGAQSPSTSHCCSHMEAGLWGLARGQSHLRVFWLHRRGII